MNLVSFLRLISRKFPILLLAAIAAASMTFHSTRNEKKEYESQAVLSTGLVSGYNIETSKGGRIDYGYTDNEMENILGMARSLETKQEAVARLLAQALMQKEPVPEILGQDAFNELKKAVPEDIRKQVVDYNSFSVTLAKVKEWRDSEGDNKIKALLEGGDAFFGVEHMETMTIKKEGKSDMIRITYSTNDPSVCRNTINILVDVFIQKRASFKEGQSSDVLAFFEKSTNDAATSLSTKEDNLLAFMEQNKIINYYEQTRFIASKKEELDEMYFKEMMTLAAADSARRHLESQLDNRFNLPKINQSLMRERESLSNISTRLANLEIGSLEDTTFHYDNKAVNSLKAQSEKIRNDIKRNAESMFAVDRTLEGVEVKTIINQWLTHWIDVEQTMARLNVFKERKAEFDRIYSRFAPWGSRMKRIEREIEIAEKAYLDNLHSYNTVRVHKFNQSMTGSLKIIDPASFPNKPKPSKRAMLVILSFLVGLILPLITFLTLELIDGSLRDPENAAETTGLELFAAFPKLNKNWQKDSTIDYTLIIERAVEQLLQHLRIDLQLHTEDSVSRVLKRSRKQGFDFAFAGAGTATPTTENSVFRVALLSPYDKDGKSTIASIAVHQLRGFGHRVLHLRILDKDNRSSTLFSGSEFAEVHPDDHFYEVGFSLFEVETEKELVQNEDIDLNDYRYIITEIPPLIGGNYPAKLLRYVDTALLVCRANRVWSASDKRALETVNKFLQRPCRLVLNATRVDLLENSLGEIPRRRNLLRRWIKKLARRNWAKSSE